MRTIKTMNSLVKAIFSFDKNGDFQKVWRDVFEINAVFVENHCLTETDININVKYLLYPHEDIIPYYQQNGFYKLKIVTKKNYFRKFPKLSDRAEIEKLIKSQNGKQRERLISYEDIVELCEKTEKKYDFSKNRKKLRGFRAKFSHDCPLDKSKGKWIYAPIMGTTQEIIFDGKNWRVMRVERTNVNGDLGNSFYFNFFADLKFNKFPDFLYYYEGAND